MAEADVFERGLAQAYVRLVEDVPCDVDGIAVARRVASESPRGQRRPTGRWFSAAPRAAWLLLLATIVLGLVAAVAVGAFAERRESIEPGPTPLPSVVPSRAPTGPPTAVPSRALTPAQQEAAIAALHEAWQFGDGAAARDVLAANATLTVEGYDRGHFEVAEPRGYTHWESSGAIVHVGAYAAEPGVAGTWDPGVDVVAVFRFGADGRIAEEWVVAGGYRPVGAHESRRTSAAPIGGTLLAWVDRCSRRDASPEASTGCYADDAELWLSVDAARGGWTEAYTGPDAVSRWMLGHTAFDGGVRTGEAFRLGNLVTYPFAGPDGPCSEGVDILELTADRSRISRRWTICGSGA